MTKSNKPTTLLNNYIYNLIGQLLSLISPMITVPYLARTLHEVGNGQVAFVNSIVSYFVSLAGFGFSLYGQREVAKNKDDREVISEIFSDLLWLRIVFSVISFIILYILIETPLIDNKYYNLIIFSSIQILAVIFDIQFYYQGIERFKSIAVRTIAIRIISIICIFIFVKQQNDIWIYLLCSAIATLVANLIMWPGAINDLVIKSLDLDRLKKHIIPSLFIFLPILSGTIFSVIDTTMIGFLSINADYENGCYGSSLKLINIISVIIIADGTVLASRNARDFAINDEISLEKHIKLGFRYVWIIGFPIAVGILVLSSRISFCFFGEGYYEVPFLLQIFIIRILTHGLMNVIGNQYFLPTGREKICTQVNFTGIVINILLNFLLIPCYGCIGAAIASVTSEMLLVVLYLLFFIRERKYWSNGIVFSSWKYIVASVLMGIPVYFLDLVFDQELWMLCILVFLGASIYGMSLIILRDEFFITYGQMYFRKFTRRFINDY